MLTASDPINVLHDTVELTVLFFTQQTETNDIEADSANLPKQIERFLVNMSKDISNSKLGSAVLPGSVLLADQLDIFHNMLLDRKRNKAKHIIRYHKDFGNDCQNPYILENDKILPGLPTYMKLDEFWGVFSDPSLHNIQK